MCKTIIGAGISVCNIFIIIIIHGFGITCSKVRGQVGSALASGEVSTEAR